MQRYTKFWHLLTGLLPILFCVLVGGGLLFGTQPASATGSCIQDVWQAHGNTQALTCTANDVRIAEVTNITIPPGGGGSCSVVNGKQVCKCDAVTPAPTDCSSNPSQAGCVTFSADYRVVLGAQTRYDIGFYFGVDSDSNNDGALTGVCTAAIILPLEEANGSTFVNLDNPNNASPLPADQCGDIDQAHNPQLLHLTISTACLGDTTLKLPNCTTWRQPGSNTVCTTTNDAYPGSPSKCNCQPGFTVPGIIVEHPTVSVTKTPNPTHITENTPTTVTYSVTVTNGGTTASVNITSLIDTPYGDITKDKNSGNSLIDSTTCQASVAQPQPIAPGGSYLCSFTVTGVQGEPSQSITDTVCARGTNGQDGSPVGPVCGTAIVTVDDVLPTATLIKTIQSASASCAVVTYQVQVVNTDTLDSLRLTALNDNKFGDITKDQTTGNSKIQRTDCGTTSGSLPATLQVGDGQPGGTDTYTCTFDALACVGDQDTVTATVVDDDGTSPLAPPSGSATLTGLSVTPTGTHNP